MRTTCQSWRNLRTTCLSRTNLRITCLSLRNLRTTCLSWKNLRTTCRSWRNVRTTCLGWRNLRITCLSLRNLRTTCLSWKNLRATCMSWSYFSLIDISAVGHVQSVCVEVNIELERNDPNDPKCFSSHPLIPSDRYDRDGLETWQLMSRLQRKFGIALGPLEQPRPPSTSLLLKRHFLPGMQCWRVSPGRHQ